MLLMLLSACQSGFPEFEDSQNVPLDVELVRADGSLVFEDVSASLNVGQTDLYVTSSPCETAADAMSADVERGDLFRDDLSFHYGYAASELPITVHSAERKPCQGDVDDDEVVDEYARLIETSLETYAGTDLTLSFNGEEGENAVQGRFECVGDTTLDTSCRTDADGGDTTCDTKADGADFDCHGTLTYVLPE
jgi:hypothetical protein